MISFVFLGLLSGLVSQDSLCDSVTYFTSPSLDFFLYLIYPYFVVLRLNFLLARFLLAIFMCLLNTLPVSAAAATAKSLQSCPTLCDPIDGSPPDSPVPGILQARTLEWVAIAFSIAHF